MLIANHEGCGPDDERQPYLVTKVTEDTANLTTFLNARAASWSEVAGTYDLDFGKADLYTRSQGFRPRSLWGDATGIGNAVEGGLEKAGNATESAGDDIADWTKGEISKSGTFNVSGGQEGRRTNVYTDSKGRLTLDCVNCFIKGSVEITDHISVKGWRLRDLSIDASPHDLAAELMLQAIITATDEPETLQYTKELWSAPIPDATIEIPGMFKLGATLSYEVGVDASFKGSATVDLSLRSGIQDSAKAVIDLKSRDTS